MPHRRTTGLAAIVALLVGTTLLWACGRDGDGSGAVRPFSEVQASDFVFEADPTNPERAIFRVTTTVPMICAIVWGESETLGNFNNSLAMNGTGIVQHDVYLPGAQPGPTYYFRVQGSAADGTMYRSDLATFTIPASSPTASIAADQTNLALDATITDVSSEFSPAFAAGNAIDDSGLTEWSSAGDGDDAFIELDLGGERAIAAVEFVTRAMLDGTAVTQTYTVTIDGQTYGPFDAGTAASPNPTQLATSGRRVRFDVVASTGGNTGAVEVRVLAD